MTFEILVIETSLKHISNCLKASMRVIWKSSRESNFEKIKHEKRIQVFKILITYNSKYSSSFTLILPSRLEDE